MLRHAVTPGSYRHVRYAPPPSLAAWVQHFWVESWDVNPIHAQTREVLPHPKVQFVFARGRSRIYGVQLHRFVRNLSGADRILGITFRPGAFYPWLREPVCSIADASMPARAVFPGADDAEEKILASLDDRDMVHAASDFLLTHLPPADCMIGTTQVVVHHIESDPTITRVGHLVARTGIRQRTLQRIFSRYVGASPQWIIKRYRIYDALEKLTTGARLEWACLAQDLGYFDQAHFINDFKKLVGRTPAAYLKG